MQHIATDTSDLAFRAGLRATVNIICSIRRWRGDKPYAPMCADCIQIAGWETDRRYNQNKAAGRGAGEEVPCVASAVRYPLRRTRSPNTPALTNPEKREGVRPWFQLRRLLSRSASRPGASCEPIGFGRGLRYAERGGCGDTG